MVVKLKEFLRKIQNLPENQRKIIRRVIVIIIALTLFLLWSKSLQFRIKSFDSQGVREQFRIPDFKEKLEPMPKIEIPELEKIEIKPEEWEKLKKGLSEEEIRQLEELMKGRERQE